MSNGRVTIPTIAEPLYSEPEPKPVADDGTASLHALADPTRWQILLHLGRAELCTTHLQDLLGAKQPVLSHHLKVLRDAGLVLTAPCGRYTYYRLRPGALDGLAVAVSHLAETSRRVPERRPC
jgi:ArsR family transcriptional regulator, arsenate/arsenite/antimonite-responsive transcriptional repressor